jgi:hypothetical protein
MYFSVKYIFRALWFKSEKVCFSWKVFWVSEIGQNKCPFSKTYSTFWKKVVEQYNILKLLKELVKELMKNNIIY